MKKKKKRRNKLLNTNMKKLMGLLLILIVILVTGKMKWDNDLSKQQVKAAKYNALLAEEKKKEEEGYSDLYKKLLSGKVTKINLIGDSITAGVGIPSHTVPKDGRIIFDNGQGEIYRESNHTNKGWGNFYRNYIDRYFPEVEFVNSGIGGKSAEWANQNKKKWLADEDVVFVMLGTNDRPSGDIDNYKRNLEEFLDYVDKNSNIMVVMSPPPSSSDKLYKFGAEEINKVIREVCEENNYKFLSHYENMLNYAANNNLDLTQLINKDGSHPIEAGYKVMWEYIEKELTLKSRY